MTLSNDEKNHAIARQMFDILALRAKQVDDPRINNAEFTARISGIAPGIKWKNDLEVRLGTIEKYCDSRALPLLSALVVLANGRHVSFPAKSFGQNADNQKIPGWKFPLSEPLKEQYRQYWRHKVCPKWQSLDIKKERADFHEWLENSKSERVQDDRSQDTLDPQGPEVTFADVNQDEWFKWPSTNAPRGPGKMHPLESPTKGLFAQLGYCVGIKGKPDDDRKETLDWIFHNKLPSVGDSSYIAQFGNPETAMRLKKMADVLASQARNYSRNDVGDYEVAIDHYKMDLRYLRKEYYAKKFGFDDEHDSSRPDLPNAKQPKPKSQKDTEHVSREFKNGFDDLEPTKPEPSENPNGPEVPAVEQPPPIHAEHSGKIPPCPNPPQSPAPMLMRFFCWLRRVANWILGRRS